VIDRVGMETCDGPGLFADPNPRMVGDVRALGPTSPWRGGD
jgi:hypothetical protein